MDLRRLRAGEAIAGFAGLVLLVALFDDWYAPTVRFGAVGRLALGFSAWTAFAVTDVLLLVVALTGLALAVLQATPRAPAGPVGAAVIATSLGVAGTLLVAYRLLDQPGPNEALAVELGAWLGLLATAGVAGGGWLSLADESAPHGEPAVPVERRRVPPPGPPNS